jgi:hypothetical protein
VSIVAGREKEPLPAGASLDSGFDVTTLVTSALGPIMRKIQLQDAKAELSAIIDDAVRGEARPSPATASRKPLS